VCEFDRPGEKFRVIERLVQINERISALGILMKNKEKVEYNIKNKSSFIIDQ
jgi:hypothetical protein